MKPIRVFALLIAASLAVAQTIDYSYDEAGRLTKIDFNDGQSIQYTWDANGNLIQRQIKTDATFVSLSSASYSLRGIVAPGSIATGFGAGVASGTATAPSTDLPMELLGASIGVTDSEGETRPSGLISVTANQASYVVPAGTAPGIATVTATTSGGDTLSGHVNVDNVAPGIYTANQQGTGVAAGYAVYVTGDGTQTRELTFDPNTNAAAPVTVGGDVVVVEIYGTGLRKATRNARALVDGIDVPLTLPVAHSVYPGLDQANLGPLPPELTGRGEVEVQLIFDYRLANVVTLTIQ